MNRSGWSEHKYVEEASNLCKGETGEIICFKLCVPVKHKLPKLDLIMVVEATSLQWMIMKITKTSQLSTKNQGFQSSPN
jgi:hypothetical protein